MQSYFKLTALAAVALSAVAAQAQVAFDANIETNSTYTNSRNNPKTDSVFDNGGRVEINATGTRKSGDYFVTARGTLIVGLNTPATDAVTVDDAWIQFGSSAADLKLGRFEATDMFPPGKDTLISTAGSAGGGYQLNTLRGRIKDGRFHAVAGVNAGPLRVELGLVAENKNVTTPYGFRPTLAYTSGPMTLRLGAESIKTTNGPSQTGYGLAATYKTGAMELNGNYAKNNDSKLSSFGLNGQFGPAGIGFRQDKSDVGSGTTDNTVYAAYSFPLFGIKDATVTPAISLSNGTNVDNVTAVRVRLNYTF